MLSMQRVTDNGRAQTPEELFSVKGNLLQGLLKHRLLGPRLRVSDSAGLGRVGDFHHQRVPDAVGSGSII